MASESRLEGTDLIDTERPEPVAVDLDDVTVPARPDHDVAAALHIVEDALHAQPYSFGFFQAVRLLERLQPDRTQIGWFDDPAHEVVRVGVYPEIAFPASEIQQLDVSGEQPKMRVNFMGLTGPQGVLPHHYSLLVVERLRARDGALADFLDMFHHRMLSLFYQAWRKYRFVIAREDGARDRLAARLADLIGLGLGTTRQPLPFPTEALLFRAGLLASQSRSAVALEQLLGDFFDVPVEVEQMVGGWYPLTIDDRAMLGEDEMDSNVLGRGAVAGDEIWDQQGRVRLRIGPLDRPRYDTFLPGGDAYRSLAALVRFYSHDQFDFEVQLILAHEDITGVRLGTPVDEREQCLGWSTWICSAPRARDAEETVLTLKAG
jgi:type VI secretion system protein ImpH